MNDTEISEKITVSQLAILGLSIYVIVILAVQMFLLLPPQLNELLNSIDNFVCLIFLIDVAYRSHKADDKLKFWKWGWIDVISSIPMINILQCGRFVRIFRILRILRAFKSTKSLILFVYKKRSKSAFLSSALMALLLVIFSSIAILTFENSPQSNIKTPQDALWWGITTMTTVGYGDKYPITPEGRTVAVVLMVAGVVLFGMFTASAAAMFAEPTQEDESSEVEKLQNEIQLLHTKIDLLTEKLKT